MTKNLFNANVNRHNLETYAMMGPKLDKSAVYNCTLCGCVISLKNSIHNEGDRLICGKCANTKFDSLLKAFKWSEGWGSEYGAM